MNDISLIQTGPRDAAAHVLLAHGAGAGGDSAFLTAVAEGLAGHAIACSRFNFGYMAARARDGVKRPPPPVATLCDEYHRVVAQVAAGDGRRLFIGGKSMGGRVASLVGDGLFGARTIAGVVCLGYPLHPPRKPDTLRVAHLCGLRCPTLMVQGERDPFGGRAEIEALAARGVFSPTVGWHWCLDGDHDLVPRVRSGLTAAQSLAQACVAIAGFVARV